MGKTYELDKIDNVKNILLINIKKYAKKSNRFPFSLLHGRDWNAQILFRENLCRDYVHAIFLDVYTGNFGIFRVVVLLGDVGRQF